MRKKVNLSDITVQFRIHGLVSSQQLEKALGIHRATINRNLKHFGDRLLTFGSGPSLKYALRREISGLGNRWSIYRIDEQGKASLFAYLHALEPSFWWVEFQEKTFSTACFTEKEFKYGIFEGFPWFLNDLRPQGFLGRAFAQRYHHAWKIASNPELWTADQILRALLEHGSDLPGALIIGEKSLEQFYNYNFNNSSNKNRNHPSALDTEAYCVEKASRNTAFPQLAAKALDEGFPGSSAGGEQPKFPVIITDSENSKNKAYAAIVKFSPDLSEKVGQRWADLLNAEYLSSQLLESYGIKTAETEILCISNRIFLQSMRFDRLPGKGRRGIVSLLSLCSAFSFGIENWNEIADLLYKTSWINETDTQILKNLYFFGIFIGNTDMHCGNISLFVGETGKPWKLSPVYDMLPMLYRPTAGGEVIRPQLKIPLLKPEHKDTWAPMLRLAIKYWKKVTMKAEFSEEFRNLANDNIFLLNQLQETYC